MNIDIRFPDLGTKEKNVKRRLKDLTRGDAEFVTSLFPETGKSQFQRQVSFDVYSKSRFPDFGTRQKNVK